MLISSTTLNGAVGNDSNNNITMSVGNTVIANINSTGMYFQPGMKAIYTGAVLQVVQVSTNTTTSTSSTTYADATGLAVTITPTSTASKILVIVDYKIYIQSDNVHQAGVQLVRNSTSIWEDSYAHQVNVNANVAMGERGSIIKLDSPASTSATTYKVQIKRTSLVGTNYSFYLNSNSGDISSITLLEIAG